MRRTLRSLLEYRRKPWDFDRKQNLIIKLHGVGQFPELIEDIDNMQDLDHDLARNIGSRIENHCKQDNATLIAKCIAKMEDDPVAHGRWVCQVTGDEEVLPRPQSTISHEAIDPQLRVDRLAEGWNGLWNQRHRVYDMICKEDARHDKIDCIEKCIQPWLSAVPQHPSKAPEIAFNANSMQNAAKNITKKAESSGADATPRQVVGTIRHTMAKCVQLREGTTSLAGYQNSADTETQGRHTTHRGGRRLLADRLIGLGHSVGKIVFCLGTIRAYQRLTAQGGDVHTCQTPG